MFEYLRSLPDRPLSARRRFVVVATALSFTLILLLWFGTWSLGRRSSPSPVPSLALETPPPSPISSPATREETPLLAQPAPSPAVNVNQISTSLLQLFAPTPSPRTPSR